MGRPVPRFDKQKASSRRIVTSYRSHTAHTRRNSGDSEVDPDDLNHAGNPIVLVHPYNGRPEETRIPVRPHPMYYQESTPPELILPPWQAEEAFDERYVPLTPAVPQRLMPMQMPNPPPNVYYRQQRRVSETAESTNPYAQIQVRQQQDEEMDFENDMPEDYDYREALRVVIANLFMRDVASRDRNIP